jgi:uncharacterized protein (DUF302 family)/glutaredoxin
MMLELFQTEWCPASRRVRQRLTELRLDYINRQVPVERETRTALREATGTDTIPALRLENGSAVVGEENHPRLPQRTPRGAARGGSAAAEGGQSAPPLPRRGMPMLATSYTLSEKTTLPFDQAVQRVREELKSEGFGVLCEIDVQATLKEKLAVEGEPYTILGACNPPLAHQALEAEPELGVLLPCNVIVYRRDGETHISAIDAERMLSIVGNEQLAPIAADVKRRLGDVVARVGRMNGPA